MRLFHLTKKAQGLKKAKPLGGVPYAQLLKMARAMFPGF